MLLTASNVVESNCEMPVLLLNNHKIECWSIYADHNPSVYKQIKELGENILKHAQFTRHDNHSFEYFSLQLFASIIVYVVVNSTN